MALSIDILCSPGWFAFAAITFIRVVTISRIPDRQATKSHIPCPNFGESRFPGSSQIPNPAPYFGQIPDPENTLPDPVRLITDKTGILIIIGPVINILREISDLIAIHIFHRQNETQNMSARFLHSYFYFVTLRNSSAPARHHTRICNYTATHFSEF